MMENFALLGSLSQRLHQEFVNLFYLMLPVFFALALVMDWVRNPAGSPDFLNTLKRAVVATLLMAAYQEIAEVILTITSGIADKISDMSGLDSIIQMAGEKAKTYTATPMSLVLGFNDLMVAILSFVSYIVLYIARFMSVAIFHFMWLFLSILSPLLILFHLFQGTSQITANLFKSLIEVASYKIVWAVLSAMITALSFGNTYSADGNYVTAILLNFVIAAAMLGTPLIIKALVGGGLSHAAGSLGMGAAAIMTAGPTRAQAAFKMGREVLGDTYGCMSQVGTRYFSQTSPSMESSGTSSNATSKPTSRATKATSQQPPPPSSTSSNPAASTSTQIKPRPPEQNHSKPPSSKNS